MGRQGLRGGAQSTRPLGGTATGVMSALMAHQDLELACWAFGHLERDDVDGFLSYVDPEAEWHSYLPELEGAFHGHPGVREWWSVLRCVVLDLPPLVEDARDLGEWILLGARARGSRAESGASSAVEFWQLAKVPERQITHYAAFPSSEGALEAAGAARIPSLP